MKVFLLSELVVHQVLSMHLEKRWLTHEQFSESAQIWISRHAPHATLSACLLDQLEEEATRIAERLIDKLSADESALRLRQVFVDMPLVNYADPLGAAAFAASLDACRKTLCKCDYDMGGAHVATPDATSSDGLRCPPALRRLICGANRRRASCLVTPPGAALAPRKSPAS